MALINCPECGHQVSDSARACPSCGYVINNEPTQVLDKKVDSIDKSVKSMPRSRIGNVGAVISIIGCAIALGVIFAVSKLPGPSDDLRGVVVPLVIIAIVNIIYLLNVFGRNKLLKRLYGIVALLFVLYTAESFEIYFETYDDLCSMSVLIIPIVMSTVGNILVLIGCFAKNDN